MGRREADEEVGDSGDGFVNSSPSPTDEKGDHAYTRRQSSVTTAQIQNPLSGMSHQELLADVEKFSKEKDLTDSLDDLQKGALISQKRSRFETIECLSEEEKSLIRREKSNRWKQPAMMYYMTSMLC